MCDGSKTPKAFNMERRSLRGSQTSFLPNSKNRTTSVEVNQSSSLTSLPHFHIFNEVIRLGFLWVLLLLRLFCKKNEVKIRFFLHGVINMALLRSAGMQRHVIARSVATWQSRRL
jgi:hypothetical protein